MRLLRGGPRRGDRIKRHSHLGEEVFEILGQYELGGGAVRPPRLDAQTVGHDWKWDDGYIGKLVRALRQRARHVIGGGDDDKGVKPAINRPAAGFHCVAQGVDG